MVFICLKLRRRNPENENEVDAMKRTKTQEAVRIAKELAKEAKSSVDFHNVFFGIGGRFGELFPEQAEREAFAKTPEYRQILELRSELRKAEKVTS